MTALNFFTCKDRNDQKHTVCLGYWTEITNNFENNTHKDIGWVTQNFPEFNNAVTMVCRNSTDESYLQAFGFPLTINLDALYGDRWTFNNESYFDFVDRQYFNYCTGDGTVRYTFRLTTANKSKSLLSFPNNDGAISENQGYFTQGTFTVNNDGTVSFYRTLIEGGLNTAETEGIDLFYEGVVPDTPDTDPYGPGGDTDDGGGDGDFYDEGEDIDFPDLPVLSAVDTGFITLFNPSESQLRNLASYMWTNPLFDVANWKKLFADPMQAILGLSIVPISVTGGGTATVKVGNISTDVVMTKAAKQYFEVDCGTLNIRKFWGAYLDYDPYTKFQIYLPYIGVQQLSADDVMGKAVHVKYHVDILSGACMAYVKCGGSVLYSYSGQCASSIPITGDNWTRVINGALQIASSTIAATATGGAAAPSAITQIASAASNVCKPTINKSGALGGTAGMLGKQKPYLIVTRPKQARPKYQNRLTGYPSYETRQLEELEGYTEIEKIHLENIPALETEKSEIEALLKGGVIF